MAEEKTLLDQWRGMAYNEQTDKNTLQNRKGTGGKVWCGHHDDDRFPGWYQ